MAGLDRNQPYSQVVNDSEGRFYEQGGAFFTAEGKPWADSTAPAASKKKPAPASQLDAQLQEPA
jgi:hypothetical protein